ncbi:MAG: LysM peptidoglycan-binding domain-containing protein [Oscillospiraceae bacterium]|nr:LysM peptidoglycan-binding domain-containing protein [Oscillospiraceae bacterium]
MKKKLISILLLVVIFATMLSTAAFAEPAVAIYTLNAGDTVSSLCARHGVNYDAYKVLIMALNSVSNEYDFAKMPVGSKIVVPVSANAASTLSGLSSAGVMGAVTGTVTNPGTVNNAGTANSNAAVGAAKDVALGDTVNCYVISYPIKSGDTVINIYKARNSDYKTYYNLMLKLNKMSNVNNLRVGQTLLLPVSSVLPGDNVVYTIMNHPMKSGETVYGVITSGYKMDYKANTELLKAINNKENLGAFKVGEVLHVAVKSYIGNSAASAATSTTVSAAPTVPVYNVNTGTVTPSYSGNGITVIR